MKKLTHGHLALSFAFGFLAATAIYFGVLGAGIDLQQLQGNQWVKDIVSDDPVKFKRACLRDNTSDECDQIIEELGIGETEKEEGNTGVKPNPNE